MTKRVIRVKRATKHKRRRFVRTRTQSDFTDLYYDYQPIIQSRVYRARVPGLDNDDVASEMSYALWLAFKSYSTLHGADLPEYWWVIWRRQRANLIRAHNAARRSAIIVPLSNDELAAVSPVVFPGQYVGEPTDAIDSDRMKAAWSLLAMGYNGTEVRYQLNMSTREYYSMIDRWKTVEVYDWLNQR